MSAQIYSGGYYFSFTDNNDVTLFLNKYENRNRLESGIQNLLEITIRLPAFDATEQEILKRVFHILNKQETIYIFRIACEVRDSTSLCCLRMVLEYLLDRTIPFSLMLEGRCMRDAETWTSLTNFINKSAVSHLQVPWASEREISFDIERPPHLFSLSNLTALELHYGIDPRIFAALMTIKTLNRLDLYNWDFDVDLGRVLDTFAPILLKTNLYHLSITGDTDITRRFIDALRYMPLVYFRMRECTLNTADIVEFLLDTIATHPSLKYVDFVDIYPPLGHPTPLTREALDCVAKHGPFAKFRWKTLDFNGHLIDDNDREYSREIFAGLPGAYEINGLDSHILSWTEPFCLNELYGNKHGVRNRVDSNIIKYYSCFAICNQPSYNVDAFLDMIHIDTNYTSTASVKHLDLVSSDISPTTLRTLSYCKDLKSLSIMNCDFVDDE